jgi:hypothetical protein
MKAYTVKRTILFKDFERAKRHAEELTAWQKKCFILIRPTDNKVEEVEIVKVIEHRIFADVVSIAIKSTVPESKYIEVEELSEFPFEGSALLHKERNGMIYTARETFRNGKTALTKADIERLHNGE